MNAAPKLKYLKGWDGQMFWRGAGGREYCRVVGGLAWSFGPGPGWIVLLGEDRARREDGERHITVLHAWEARGSQKNILTPQEIMCEAVSLSNMAACFVWVSPLDLPDAALVPAFNRERGRHERKLMLRTPPLYERGKAFSLYDRLLEHHSRARSFHMEGARRLSHEYVVIDAKDRARPLEEFPAAAAMLYALAWLELTPGPYAGREAQNFYRQYGNATAGGAGY